MNNIVTTAITQLLDLSIWMQIPPPTLLKTKREKKLRVIIGSRRGTRRTQHRYVPKDVFGDIVRDATVFQTLCGFTPTEFQNLLSVVDPYMQCPREVYAASKGIR